MRCAAVGVPMVVGWLMEAASDVVIVTMAVVTQTVDSVSVVLDTMANNANTVCSHDASVMQLCTSRNAVMYKS